MTTLEIVVAFIFLISSSISFTMGVFANYPFKTELGKNIYLIIFSIFGVLFTVSFIMCCTFTF